MANKPLWRWTVGSCLQQGLDILAESVDRTISAIGEDRFDWMICHNGLNSDQLSFIEYSIEGRNITLETQKWEDCAIPDQCGSPIRPDGSFEWNGNSCGGTLWKVAPARKRIDTHEIVMDNDIVILKMIPAIEKFLEAQDKVLILEEPIRFYGVYDSFFDLNPPFLNSGLMGFCPGYDYDAALRKKWKEKTKWCQEQNKNVPHYNLSQADEQGLLMLTLKDHPNIRVGVEYVHEILGKDYGKKITGSEYAIHFTQSNRMPNHHSWLQYKQIVRNAVF